MTKLSPTWLLVGLIALFAAAKIIVIDTLDPDAFWHLRVADQLSAQGVHPLVDELSWASMREPWTPYSWLAELGMRALWRAGGPSAAVGVTGGVVAVYVILIALACQALATRANQASAITVSLATAWGVILSMPYLSFRPVTLALAVLALVAWLLLRDRVKGERTRAVWTIPLLTAALINVHFFALLTPCWIGALLAGAVLEWRRSDFDARRQAGRRAARYLVLLIATTLACLATPMLPGMFRAVFYYQSHDPMVHSTLLAETQPFWTGGFGHVAAALTAIAMLLIISRPKRLRAGEWVWLLGSVALLLRMGRLAPLFALIACPALAATMPAMSQRVLARPAIRVALTIVLLLGVARVILSLSAPDRDFDRWLNRNLDTGGYPCDAARYVETHIPAAHHRLLNEFSWGGYLAWRLGPSFQVSSDGRTQVYSPAWWAQTELNDATSRERVVATCRCDAAVLPVHSIYDDALLKLKWVRVFADHRAVVWKAPTGQ